jgi:hypothetical protein
MPPERLSELFDALIRPSFLQCEIERSDGAIEPFDPLTLFSSLIESEVDLGNATRLFDEIVAAIHALQTEGIPLRLKHSDVHDLVAGAILRHPHAHSSFWLSNYESMFARDVEIEDDKSAFIDARNASVLRAEIKYFLEGKRDDAHGDSASLRDITNRVIKLVRFCGFYKLRRDFLHQFLDELSVSSAKAFIPDIAISEEAFTEQLDSVERMFLAVPGLPPEQHINFCSATLAMLSSAILGWLGVIHASSHQDSLKHVKTTVEDFYRDRQRRADASAPSTNKHSDIASLLALRGRLDAVFTRANLEPKVITDTIDAILTALSGKHVAELIFFAEKLIRYFRILSAESEFPRVLSEFRFGEDPTRYLEAISARLTADGVEIAGKGIGYIEVQVNTRFHKIVEYGDRLRIMLVDGNSPEEVDKFDFNSIVVQSEADRSVIFCLVVQKEIGGLFKSNLRSSIERTRRFITAMRRDEFERCIIRGEDLRTLAHRNFFHIFPEGAEWQDTEIFKFDEPQLPQGLRPRERELLKSALGAIEKGPETTPTLQTLRLLESRIKEHALLIYAIAMKLNCLAASQLYPIDRDFSFSDGVRFLREVSDISKPDIPRRILGLLPTQALLREVDQLRQFRNIIAHNDLTIDPLRAKDAMHRAAACMAQLSAFAKGYMKVAADADSQRAFRFNAEGELTSDAWSHWRDVAASGRRQIRVRWRFGYVDIVDQKFSFLAQTRCTVCGRATRMMMATISNRYFCETCDDNPQVEGDWERFIATLKASVVDVDKRDRTSSGQRPLISRRTLSLPSAARKVTLDEANYQEILGIIENMTLVMERSPDSFKSMGEEDLRQHYLVQLNGQYRGAATGETFNFVGKTDILIRVDGRNVFIGECKFWRGEKVFMETIDQILSYLSWRDTKAAAIIFNRTKQFTSVLDKIRAALEGHPKKVGGLQIESETRFRCRFSQPEDKDREVILTVMVFDIPT